MEIVYGILNIFFKTPAQNLLIITGIIFILISILGHVFKKFKIDKTSCIVLFLIGIVISSIGITIKQIELTNKTPIIKSSDKTKFEADQPKSEDKKALTTKQKLLDKVKACKKLNILKTVEAENCFRNGWKDWALPEFSNGLLISNESTSQMGRATNATLNLDFNGKGVIIIYRQDTWYGILTVEIDGKKVGYINQRGRIINKAEKCFEAGEMGQHSLVLRGLKSKKVVTVDAIKILGD